LIGQVVNYRYEILEKCGDGSFFSVYKARDKVLNRLVAVKVLIPRYAENKDFAERVTAEFQRTIDLTHQNIAKVLEADSADGICFTATEYVRGLNLKDRIRRTSPFTVSHAVDIAIAVCEALEYAHKKGYVHGDVRSQNILTDPEGQVKLTDFAMEPAISAFPEIASEAMLRSIYYTAPEVAGGGPVTPSTDLYSLGIVLYEMLTGQLPYEGETPIAIALKHAKETPRAPKLINAAVPKALDDVVIKAMGKTPAERYSSAGAMLADLRKVRDAMRMGEPTAWSAKTAKPARVSEEVEDEERPENVLRSTLKWLLVFFVVVVLIAVLVVYVAMRHFPASVAMPDLKGKTWDEALQIAEAKGLQLSQEEEFNDKYPVGQIYFTNPGSGSSVSKSNPNVKVWVSLGPRLVTVPDVTNLPRDKATRQINDAKLVVGHITQEYSDSVAQGSVIRQTPPPNDRLEPMKGVDLVISQGSQTLPTEGEDTSALGRARDFDVKVPVPDDVTDPSEVRIVVIDDRGQTTPYTGIAHPGDTIRESVRAYGEHVKIQVYVGDQILKEEER
jgi:eukaryotic-like serine/threonine-protein kinase